MPIYEYRCQNCQHEIEVIQKMADEALTKCDACGKDSLTKLISRSSFQLKGSGWYQTDFKNPPAKASSDNKSEAKSEHKPETKSESSSASDKPTVAAAAPAATTATTKSSTEAK